MSVCVCERKIGNVCREKGRGEKRGLREIII
jgi:hypothetical protein